ncbi:hypothetical protein [Micromonospora sp. B9E7]|uniref:hypothetical protein n=1 Tax=Micromonospora sp. B9E7 TaxID=3153574 RepID=UPI00325CC605
MYLSLSPGAVPPEVLLAAPVPGLHLIHSAVETVGSAGENAGAEMVVKALLAQPMAVVERMVDAPRASVTRKLTLPDAIARADRLGMPVRVPGTVLGGVDNDRVLPIGADSLPADYVLVLPERHLLDRHAGDLDPGRVTLRVPMPGQVRLAGDRVEVGRPLSIVDARFAGRDIRLTPAGRQRPVDGLAGLWRALSNLAPGEVAQVRVTPEHGDPPSVSLAVSSEDGTALLTATPDGLRATTIPRNAATMTLTAARMLGPNPVVAYSREAVQAAIRSTVAAPRAEPALPMFVLSTATDVSFADRDVPALHPAVVDQLVERLGQQYPGSPIQLIGPDPGGLLRNRHPQSFGLIDALSAVGHGHLGESGRAAMLAELGAQGATLIGVTDDIANVPGGLGLRTLWLGGKVRPDGPVSGGLANSQRFELPIDWPVRRDAVGAAVGGLPPSVVAVRAAMHNWLASVRDYRRRLNEGREADGQVDHIRALRHRLAEDVEAHLLSGLAALDEGVQAVTAWWNAFQVDPAFDLSQNFQLAPTEIYGVLRRAVNLDWALGPTVVPESIKGHEFAPARLDRVPGSRAGELQIQMNPVWTPLAALTAAHFADSPRVPWQFSVTSDGLPWFGSENASKIMPDREWSQNLRAQVDGLGHPTIGASFGPDGRFVVGDNRVGGQVHYEPDDGILIFNDMSGRTMSPKVRPRLTAKESETWVAHVARMVSAQTGLDFEIGISKQFAKAALKSNPGDSEALALVSIVKAGLSDRRAVAVLREAAGSLDGRVSSALARLPSSAAKTEATRAWQAFQNTVAQSNVSAVGAAAKAVAAYLAALSKVSAAVGPSAPRVLPDPGYFFPLSVAEISSGLWIGSGQVPDEAAGAVRRLGEQRTVEVRFRANPDQGDIGLMRLALLRQPAEVIAAAAHRPAGPDLTESFDAPARADGLGLPVDMAKADVPQRYLTQPPEASVWLDEHGQSVESPHRAHYLRVLPTNHLVEQHLDYDTAVAEAVSGQPLSPPIEVGPPSWQSDPRPRFAKANRSRWQSALTSEDRAKVDAVVEAVRRIGSDDPTLGPKVKRELAVVAALRSLNVLRDQHGAARRGEHLLAEMERRFARDRRANPAAVRRMMVHHRTDLAGSDREVLDLAGAAVRLALAHGSALPAAHIDAAARTLTVEFAAAGGSRPVLNAGRNTMPVDVVQAEEWTPPLTDAAVLVDGRLKIRADASDRSLVIGIAGLFAQIATTGAARLNENLMADSAEALHTKRTIVRRIYFAGSTWGTTRPKRWLKKHLSMPHTTEVLRAELRAIDEQLQVSDPGHTDTAVWGVDQPAHLTGKASFADHLARRMISASSIGTTFAGGLSNDPPRAMALMGASVAGTGTQNIVQAVSDALAANVSGNAAPKTVLATPKRWGELGQPTRTALGLPTAQVTKRAPSALAMAAASGLVTGLVGLDVPPVLDTSGQVLADGHKVHRWDLAGLSTALQGGQSLLAGAGSDWVFDLWEGRAKATFERALKGSPDHRRNQYVEIAFHHTLELYGRWTESLKSGVTVPEHLKADVAELMGQVNGLAWAVEKEVDNKVADLRRRRRLLKRFIGMFGRQQGRESYDLVDRGLPNGMPKIWHNMLRTGIQYSAAQVPSQVIGHLAGSAAGLADGGVISGAGRGLAYGAGWSALKNHEFRDAMAVAAWDARFHLGVVRALLDAIVKGEPVPDGQVPRAADAQRHPWLAQFSQATARVVDQRRINRDNRRPTEISKRTQMLYKHVPATAGGALGYGIAAGAGMIAAPVALPLILTVAGVLTVTGAGETYLRTHEPRHRQAARFAGAAAEVGGQPRSSEQFVEVLRDNLREAVAANVLIKPTHMPANASVLRRFGHWQRDGVTDVWVSGSRRVRRVLVWTRDQIRGGEPPRNLTRQPIRTAGPVRLTSADRAEVDALHEILTDLDNLKRWAVGDHGDRDLLRTALALHLDKLGLWQDTGQQDWSWDQTRWAAIAAALRSRHGRVDPLVGAASDVAVESADSMAAVRGVGSDKNSPYRVAVDRERERTNHLWAGIAAMSSTATGTQAQPWVAVVSPTKLQLAVGDLKNAELTVRVDPTLGRHAEVALRLRHWSAPNYELVVRDDATLHDPDALGHLIRGAAEHIRINRPGIGSRSWNVAQHAVRAENRYPVLRMPLEPSGPPSWPMRLTDTVTAHPHVHVISSHTRGVPSQLITDLTEAADADHPVILLDAQSTGRPVLASDLATLNYLLEQFAQRDRLPIVVTRGSMNGEVERAVLTVARKYGAAVLHPTLQRSGGSGLVGLQVGYRWKITAPRQDGQDARPGEIWDRITAGVLHAATELARPTAAVSRVDDRLGELIWAADLNAARDVFDSLREHWSPQRLKVGLAQVRKMIERVPDQPALSVFDPVLEFGAAGHAEIVFDYACAEPAQRPRVLLDAVGRLDAAGQLDPPVEGGLTTAALASMTKLVGPVDATDISGSMLNVVKLIRTQQFTGAGDFVNANRGKLTVEQKQQWVDAIAGLSAAMPANADQLHRLSRAVLDC